MQPYHIISITKFKSTLLHHIQKRILVKESNLKRIIFWSKRKEATDISTSEINSIFCASRIVRRRCVRLQITIIFFLEIFDWRSTRAIVSPPVGGRCSPPVRRPAPPPSVPLLIDIAVTVVTAVAVIPGVSFGATTGASRTFTITT